MPMATNGFASSVQNNTLGFSNKMFFHTPELFEVLTFLHRWISSLLILGNATSPESYLASEPIKLSGNPIDPDHEMHGSYEIPTVRDWFKSMIEATNECGNRFDYLTKEAHGSFDNLPSDSQERLMAKSLMLNDICHRTITENCSK